MQTERYRRQHETLRALVADIPTSAAAVAETQVRGLLIKFIGTLRAHLVMEDTYLYPAMMKHPDAAVREKAEHFQKEMGNLSAAIEEFFKTWSAIGTISKDPQAFVDDWKRVFATLANRMNREDNDLYALIDNSVKIQQSA